MSLKIGISRNKHKLCCSEFCKDLPSYSHSRDNIKNQLLDNLLKPQLSQALLERERDFKRIYSATFERCREETAQSDAYRNRFILGHHFDTGQKVLYENHRPVLSKSQKLQQRRLRSFTVTKLGRSSKFYGHQPRGIARGVTYQSPTSSRWSIRQLNPYLELKRTKKLSNDEVVWNKLNLGTKTYSKG